jgi:hypothetical protein
MNLSKEKKEDNDIAVYIITHGPECYQIPDYCLPLEVGAALRNNFQYELRDDSSDDNISKKNKLYSEITGLYWMWKNDNHKHVGLYHYRRMFNLNDKKIREYLKKYDFIFPKKIRMISTCEEFYKSAHSENDWEIMINVLKEMYPQYYLTSQLIFQQKRSYYYNMFITKKGALDKYCNWLFPLIAMIENRLDLRERDEYQSKAIAFMCERLFTLYVLHNNFKIKEVRICLFGDITPKWPAFLLKLFLIRTYFLWGRVVHLWQRVDKDWKNHKIANFVKKFVH